MGWIHRPRLNKLLALFLVLGAALAAGCGRNDALPQSLMDPRGQVARMQIDLLNLSLYFAAGIGAIVTIVLIFVVLKFRARPEVKEVPKQIHGSTALEITWTLIPIVILIILGVPTVRTAFGTATPASGLDMKIVATGNQWWFGFQYPDQGNFVVGNEMVVPVNTKIEVELRSRDVIHSFWIPKLAGKMDMVPNRVNSMWIEAGETGMYYGQCAEFCGTQHAQMRFRVKVVSKEEFDGWAKRRQAGAVEPTDPVALKGKEVAMKTCAACHAIDGTTAKGVVGPNLSNVGERSTLAAGIIENTEENLKQWIRNPQAIKPGVKMASHPPAVVSDADLNALVKYLQGLK